MSDGQRWEELLPVQLTEKEERAKGKVLAHVFERYRKVQADKKNAAAAFKEQENAHLEEMETLRAIVSSGYEERMVTVAWVYDYSKGKRAKVRQDTGEVIDTQAIPATELQTDLGLS